MGFNINPDSILQFYNDENFEHHFNKKYDLIGPNHLIIDENTKEDEFENRFLGKEEWTVNELTLIEENLNRVKNELNDFSFKDWSTHTRKYSMLNTFSWKTSFTHEKSYKQFKPEFFSR
jgi:hypothetical protein